MPNGKIRHENHMIDSRAILFIQNELPVEWVVREYRQDYGIDLEVELFDYEDEKCVTLGEHVLLQVKGTVNPKYGKTKIVNGDSRLKENGDIDVLKFSIEVSLLNLVERMGSGVPVLLVVVDLEKEKAFYICLNDYIRYVLPFQNPGYKLQKEVTIYIPCANDMLSEALLWYGKRPKLYSFFQEAAAVQDHCLYLDGFEYVDQVKKWVYRLKNNEIFSVRNCWGYLEVLYDMVNKMVQNEMVLPEGEMFVKMAIQDEDITTENDWKTSVLYRSMWDDEEGESGLFIAQEISSKRIMEFASIMSGTFDSLLRHRGLPTVENVVLLDES